MKRKFVIAIILLLALTACGPGDGPLDQPVAPGTDPLASQVATGTDPVTTSTESKVDEGSVPETTETTETAETTEAGDVDVDLTKLSSTMVYAEVYNILVSPEEYIGKQIRMAGVFSVYTDPSTGKNYFACIISDATACCAQGIEFELAGEHTYPDEYPSEGTEVTVVGEFETYDEGGLTYARLKDAVFE